MKRSFFLLLFVSLLLSNLQAQNLIAVQNGGSPTFYQKLDSAIFHAQNGDTLYLPGGFVPTAGNIVINKSIHIIGVGYRPDSNLVTGNTIIQHDVEVLSDADGGSITGLFAKNNQIIIYDQVNNFKISRCYLGTIVIGMNQGNEPPSNILIVERISDIGIFAHCTATTSPINVVINNCIIGSWTIQGPYDLWDCSIGSLDCYNTCWSFYSWNGLTIKNSIVYGMSFVGSLNYNWVYNPFFKGITNSYFDNCVFVDNPTSWNSSGSANNIFNNCIFNRDYGYVGDAPANILNNCYWSQNMDNIFVNAPCDPGNNHYQFYFNYHLSPASPGKNAGTDGTDIGVYGGTFPWKDGGLPQNPHFQHKNISGATDQNGNLNVNIKVAAQDH